MEKSDYSVLPDALRQYAELEDLIFEGSKESLEKAQKIVDDVGKNITKAYLFMITILAGSVNDKRIREYAEFLKKNGPYSIDVFMPSNFAQYLVLTGVVDKEQFSDKVYLKLKDFKFEWEPNSIQDLIVKGDKKALDAIEDLSDVEITLFGEKIRLMEFALRFGSCEICEYFLNEREVFYKDLLFVVTTRDLNKLKLFRKNLKKKVLDDFDEIVECAYTFHAPYIVDYIIENFPYFRGDYNFKLSMTGYNTVDWYKQIKELPTYDEKVIKSLVATSQIHVLNYFIHQTPDKIKLEDSAFQAAGKLGDIETIKFMMSTKEYQINKEKCLQMLLKGALKGQKPKVIEYLIDNGAKITDKIMFTGLYSAITHENEEFLKVLIDKYNAKFDLISDTNETLLMAAAKSGNNELCEELLELGVDVNQQNNDGYTALMYAVDNERIETVELLIKKGANVNLQNNEGNTALILACDSYRKLDIIKLLSDNNADFNIVNKKGKKAENIANDHGIFTKVIDFKLDQEFRQKREENPQPKPIAREDSTASYSTSLYSTDYSDSDDTPKTNVQSTKPITNTNTNRTESTPSDMERILAHYDPESKIQWVQNLINDTLKKNPQERALEAKHILQEIPKDLIPKIDPSLLRQLEDASKYEPTKDDSYYYTTSDYSDD